MSGAGESLHRRYGAALPPPGVWNATLDLLLAHRSVRHYTNDPLPDGALEAALAAAQSASTSSNLQLWSVIAVEDGPRKQRLSVHAAVQFLHARPATIYGGSNEIQRNILAAHLLKLS